MNLITLCNSINMPEEVTKDIIKMKDNLDYTSLKPASELLLYRPTWQEGLALAKNILGQDDKGFKMLTFQLAIGVDTYKRYEERGISEEIFINTFKCFSRFVREHMVSYKTYGFDREWWTPRQLSMEEFRLGELEFEFVNWKEERVVSVHIPSDAILTKEYCLKAYSQANEFFLKYYPELAYRYFICDSWMLSPGLKEVLSPESRILQFQQDYTIEEWNKENQAYKRWVFKNDNLSMEEVPEDTSLQRNIKKFVLDGGLIGSAFGYMKKE